MVSELHLCCFIIVQINIWSIFYFCFILFSSLRAYWVAVFNCTILC